MPETAASESASIDRRGDGAMPRAARALTVTAWLVLAAAVLHPADGLGVSMCPSKVLTDLPCPGCGMTRSVSCAVRGEVSRSVEYHPFGVVFLAAVVGTAFVGVMPRGARVAAWGWAGRRRRVLAAGGVAYLVLMLAYGVARMAGLVGQGV